jgi:anthraniloyl-CoA monooxygenase
MEDAIALAESFRQTSDVQSALSHFAETRRPVIEQYQGAAFDSMVWFENVRQYMHARPIDLAFSVMTRSGKVTYDDLKRRDPEFIRRFEESTPRGRL